MFPHHVGYIMMINTNKFMECLYKLHKADPPKLMEYSKESFDRFFKKLNIDPNVIKGTSHGKIDRVWN